MSHYQKKAVPLQEGNSGKHSRGHSKLLFDVEPVESDKNMLNPTLESSEVIHVKNLPSHGLYGNKP